MDSRPIGIFDSGMGGIAVLKVAKDILCHENFIYFGDNKNAPYGVKTREEIFDLSKACVDFLISKNVKAILIACNTATGVSVKQLREMYSVPFVSMEPAVKVGMKNSHGGKILVMATPATLRQEKYKNLVTNLHAEDEVIEMPCEGLAALIEKGVWDGPVLEEYLYDKFYTIKDEVIDACVLGCTHYTFVKSSIDKMLKSFGQNAVIVDGSEGTSRHLKDILEQQGKLAPSSNRQQIDIYSSDPAMLPMMKNALYS